MPTAKTAVRVGPQDHGRRMSLEEFGPAEGEPGYRYELARGVIEVSDIPSFSHGSVVSRLHGQVYGYEAANPGWIKYHGRASECVLQLPGMQSERHPDLGIYLLPKPPGEQPWREWVPAIVVEVISKSSKKRDYEEKRAEYLAAGVIEYWILDPEKQALIVLKRDGDTFRETVVKTTYETHLLPGFRLDVARLFES